MTRRSSSGRRSTTNSRSVSRLPFANIEPKELNYTDSDESISSSDESISYAGEGSPRPRNSPEAELFHAKLVLDLGRLAPRRMFNNSDDEGPHTPKNTAEAERYHAESLRRFGSFAPERRTPNNEEQIEQHAYKKIRLDF